MGHHHLFKGKIYLIVVLVKRFLPGHPVSHSQVYIRQIGKLLNRPGMIVDSVVIGPVPNRRFFDYERVRLCRLWCRVVGRRKKKFFFELSLVETFTNGVLFVLYDSTAPVPISESTGRVIPHKIA